MSWHCRNLTGRQGRAFSSLQKKWGHNYSVLLKAKGFPVGLTSGMPIEVIEKRVKGFHHGYLHVKTQGVHFIVVHLWPGKEHETEIISGIAQKLIDEGEKVVVLGDFNSESPLDGDYINTKPALKGKVHYGVLCRYMEVGLVDIVNRCDKNALVSQPSPAVIPKWQPDMKSVEAKQHRIDFILTSDNLSEKCVDATIIRNEEVEKVSDHYPVIAKFRFDNP